MWYFEIIIMCLMVGINSVFAGYEIALASTPIHQLQRLAADKRRGAAVALHMKQNIEASLAVVQLGITAVGAVAAAVGGVGAYENLSPVLMQTLGVSGRVAEVMAIALVVIPLTAVTIVAGELLPKVFALRNAQWVCLTLSPLMRWLYLGVKPIVWLLETTVKKTMWLVEFCLGLKCTQEKESEAFKELRAITTLARAERLIGHREERIILGAMELQSRPVRGIMLAASHINTLDVNDSLADSLIAAHLDMHTRFPVVERKGDPQSIIGFVNVKDIIATLHLSPQMPNLRAIVRHLPSFWENQPVAACLEQMMREHVHIALVRDTGGSVLGMITLEDILEELVGEIEDEYDRLPVYAIRSDASWVVGGGMSIDRLKTVSGIDLGAALPLGGARTLSEWVIGHLGRSVRGGDSMELGCVRILIRKATRNKVQEAQVSQWPAGARQSALQS